VILSHYEDRYGLECDNIILDMFYLRLN